MSSFWSDRYSSSPTTPVGSGSPYPSIFSDVTMSDAGEDDANSTPPPARPRMQPSRDSSGSVLEYSDTDEEPARHQRRSRKQGGATGSTFRVRNDSVTKSMRVVKFNGQPNQEQEEKRSNSQRDQQRPKRRSSKQSYYLPQPILADNWMAQLAYSFRSPSPTSGPNRKHARETTEYPHTDNSQEFQQKAKYDEKTEAHEQSPLLAATDPNSLPPSIYVEIAATFMKDYEASRPPTLSSEIGEITLEQIQLYNLRYGVAFSLTLIAAALALFVSCFYEGFVATPLHRNVSTGLNFFAITVFVADMWIRHKLHEQNSKNGRRPRYEVRHSRSDNLVKPMILFCVLLAVENLGRMMVTSNTLVLFSSLLKPLALFYTSSRARDALEALSRIFRLVMRVIMVELLLILMFAAVACRLFSEYERFQDLSTSWLSLFELATTVVNPSIWMPMYKDSSWSAVFFIFFIVVAVFYLHSLVLSVVFQTYIQAATDIHQRSATDREDTVRLASVALQHAGHDQKDMIDIALVRETLSLVRPHYGAMKINALVEIVAPSQQGAVDFPTFRAKIRQALNASVRTARLASTLALGIELIAVFVALINFIYVILVSSTFSSEFFDPYQERIGCVITFVAAFELIIRFNPLRIPDFVPLTRLNATFDGFAAVAATISFIGFLLMLTGRSMSLELLLMGRAIDMLRVMRFFQIFRDVVRRSTDVMPALIGPIILVITTLHIFVYLGMSLWGGAIVVGQQDGQITYLYDLNNFNSYQEGLVTMFQVLVVNDWHAIAEVFLFANRCSSAYIVFPFFVFGNLIGVSVMLNLLTAFFVESFVTKLHDDTDGPAEATATVHKDRDFATKNTSVRRISSGIMEQNDTIDHGADADSEGSSESELFEFDVYEREGFDKIMQTVAGSSQSDFCKQVCGYLEIFESLSPGREAVGYLIVDQQTLERFGNRRFEMICNGFLKESELHVVVSDMHSELLALSSRASFQDRSLIRRFRHKHDPNQTLEVSAALLRRHPALSLFVSRIVPESMQSA